MIKGKTFVHHVFARPGQLAAFKNAGTEPDRVVNRFDFLFHPP